jgi:phosphopantetheinyl transferase
MNKTLRGLVYAVTGVPPAGQRYARTESGKPVLLHPEGWQISVSHSRGREAAALSKRLIGVDVELVRPYHAALARRVFTPDERLVIAASDNPDAAYTRLWTLRESLCKCTGEGMRGLMSNAGKRLPSNYVWRSMYSSNHVITVCVVK